MGYEIYKYISSAHHKSVTTDVSQQMATRNSRTAARVLAAASMLLSPLLVLATTVSLAFAVRPAPAIPSLQSAASAPMATDIEPGDAAGKLLVTKVVSPFRSARTHRDKRRRLPAVTMPFGGPVVNVIKVPLVRDE